MCCISSWICFIIVVGGMRFVSVCLCWFVCCEGDMCVGGSWVVLMVCLW